MMNIQKKEEVRAQRATPEIPKWWAVAPAGERRFLNGLRRMVRSAKQSPSREVAQAAVKWERALGCFIKVRLIGEQEKAERRRLRGLKAGFTSCPSDAHSPSGAAPSQG